MHLLVERVVFWGGGRGFLKEGVKAYLAAKMLPLNSLTFFLSSHLRSYGSNWYDWVIELP
jgi:hypothetical protein